MMGKRWGIEGYVFPRVFVGVVLWWRFVGLDGKLSSTAWAGWSRTFQWLELILAVRGTGINLVFCFEGA
jgi:hypothetical protein